ncbi:MAG TPA: hypothetical protein VNB23_01580, partial [Ramlibacter sp.]|nr:hypothetical protein [Ramlibacter sp.]
MLSRFLLPALLSLLPAAAHALCTSDGVPQPALLLERFVSADCADCWSDPLTPQAAAGALAIDWIVPGRKGAHAPLSAAAAGEAVDRLAALGRTAPDRTDAVSRRREGGGAALRVAQGAAFNDYIGTSIELKGGGREAWRAWLLLVESLPAGTEGSPVARNLVRNVFRAEWPQAAGQAPARRVESRAMQIHEGAKPERLRL